MTHSDDDTSLLYRMAMASMRSLTPALATDITSRVGGEENFFTFSPSQLSSCLGYSNRLFEPSLRAKALEGARAELDFVRRASITPLYYTDHRYPGRLLECADAPLMLYTMGPLDLNATRLISIVGTRHATAYGTAFVDDAVAALRAECACPVAVVSGLAYGIDVAAHRASLASGVPTAAVLAHGLNTIYPAVHRDTAARIIGQGGMLLTEYRSADAVHKGNFLQRNRIVAGMSDATLVVESDSHGGAMVTARLALAYSRDVFAVPGRTSDRYSRGCNALIAQCVARLVTSPADLIEALGWPLRSHEGTQGSLFEPAKVLTAHEQAVIDTVTARGDTTLQELSARIDLPTPRLMALLIDMELRSLIQSVPGGRYMAK